MLEFFVYTECLLSILVFTEYIGRIPVSISPPRHHHTTHTDGRSGCLWTHGKPIMSCIEKLGGLINNLKSLNAFLELNSPKPSQWHTAHPELRKRQSYVELETFNLYCHLMPTSLTNIQCPTVLL